MGEDLDGRKWQPMATITRSVSNGWKKKPKRRFPPEVLTDAEVRALLDASPVASTTGIRNRALIAILHRAGLRISEALDLYPSRPPRTTPITLRRGRSSRDWRSGSGRNAWSKSLGA